MDERKSSKFTVIENTKTDEVEKISKSSAIRHTNPIMKKMLEFHQEKAGKFSIRDLFKP